MICSFFFRFFTCIFLLFFGFFIHIFIWILLMLFLFFYFDNFFFNWLDRFLFYKHRFLHPTCSSKRSDFEWRISSILLWLFLWSTSKILPIMQGIQFTLINLYYIPCEFCYWQKTIIFCVLPNIFVLMLVSYHICLIILFLSLPGGSSYARLHSLEIKLVLIVRHFI